MTSIGRVLKGGTWANVQRHGADSSVRVQCGERGTRAGAIIVNFPLRLADYPPLTKHTFTQVLHKFYTRAMVPPKFVNVKFYPAYHTRSLGGNPECFAPARYVALGEDGRVYCFALGGTRGWEVIGEAQYDSAQLREES